MKSKSLIWVVAGVLLILILVQGVQAAETYSYVTQWGSLGAGDGQFNTPEGIAVNRTGYAYVSDTLNNRVQVFKSTGDYFLKWGSHGIGNEQFQGPGGIAVNGSDYVYVADSGNWRILVFDPSGSYVCQWASTFIPPNNFYPVDVAVNSTDYVYVVDHSQYRVLVFSPSGIPVSVNPGSPGSGNGQFNDPISIAIDSKDNIYVVDRGNYRVQKFDPSLNYITQWGSHGVDPGQFVNPDGIAVDSSDNIYVVDNSIQNIQVFSSSGVFITRWGSSGTGPGEFNFPFAIAVDSSDYNYVVDMGNNRIQKFDRVSSWKFHADAANTGVYDNGGITPTNNVMWTFQTDDKVKSSPAVAEGVVYVGSMDKKVYALDAATGAKLWQKQLGGVIYSSPAVVNNVLYIGCDDGKVYALDTATGGEIWNFYAGGMYGVQSSPTFWNNTVYIGTMAMGAGKVYALDAFTGTKKWENTTGGMILSSPAVANGMVYVGSYDRKVYAWDAIIGIEKWEFMTGDVVSSSPAVSNGVVYVGSMDKKVYALDAYDGHKIWDSTTGNTVSSSPAIANGVVYVGSLDAYVYALNAATGAQLWQKQLGGIIYSSPAVANGVVYIGSTDNKVYALDATTGNKMWDVATGASIFDSSPAVANGMVYIGSDDGKVYALGGTPAPTVTSINPNIGVNTGSVSITDLAGTGFALGGATVKLKRSGQADIVATGVLVVSPTQITCTLPILGAATGAWDVVVTNPDLQFGTLAGGFTVTAPSAPPVTQGQAVDIAKARAGTTPGKEGVTASQTSLSPGTNVHTMRGTSTSPNYGTWLVSINHNPRANLESRFTNYYVYNDQVVSSEEVWSPPLNIPMTINDLNGNPGDPGGNGPAPTESTICSYVTCENCWALLISGGYNPENNHIRYWYDMSSMYKTLRQKYCYPEGNIYVLMSDGTSDAPDRRDVDTNGLPVYDSSPLDLDGKDRAVDVHGKATKANIVETLTNLDELGKLTDADTLFIFTTNHGGKDPSSSNVRLWLWQGDYIWDYEFANLLNAVQANTIAMTMEQCYSGGFIDDFTTNVPSGQTRVIATAASADEPSYGNDFSYQWIKGVGGPADIDGIGDNNGLISMWESFDYGKTNDPSYIDKREHPQYGDATPPSGEGKSLSSCSKVVCSLPPNPIPIVNQPGGFYPTPTDPDRDCIIYEDVNGDGTFNFLDVILFFNQMEWIADPANEPVSAFDANRNGRIDFADIVNLYWRVP